MAQQRPLLASKGTCTRMHIHTCTHNLKLLKKSLNYSHQGKIILKIFQCGSSKNNHILCPHLTKLLIFPLSFFFIILLIFSCVAYSTDQHPAIGQAHRFCLTCLFQPRTISHCFALPPSSRLSWLRHWPLEKMWPVHILRALSLPDCSA